MRTVASLNKSKITPLRELNSLRESFNIQNSDFFDVYDDLNFLQQLFYRKRVKLLKKGLLYIGYIWSAQVSKTHCIINSLYLPPNSSEQSFKELLATLYKYENIEYVCERNFFNFHDLEKVGFNKKGGIIELKLSITDFLPLEYADTISFEILKKESGEEIRCKIQNEVFKNDNRIPLNIEDMYFDEAQSYYIGEGAIFIKDSLDYVGYGQIILEKDYVSIVNFGIVVNYRRKGYGKLLLAKLLNTIKSLGFKEVAIKVDSDNSAALELYQSFGFSVTGEVYNFELKTK
jgi:ribosomal protein S18 acetylase RimI-like enzyme